jgi:hypothetical protein
MVVFGDPGVYVDIQNIVESLEPFGIKFIVAILVDVAQVTVVILIKLLVTIKIVCRLLEFDGVGERLSARDLHK